MYWTTAFWKATTERAIASTAGGALSVIGAGAFGVVDADWPAIASIAAGAGVVSLLKALAAGAKDGNPSAINAEKTTDAKHRAVTSAALDNPHNSTP